MSLKIYETVPSENRFFGEAAITEGNVEEAVEVSIVNIFEDVEYQEILGFGAAFTESAAYNYSLLDEKKKKEFLEKYFDRKNGIGYNFGRTHINSCDFSLDIYSYVEEGDTTLETFSIERDRKYIIPFLKDALSYCEEEIILFASPWSPPAYMKNNGNVIGGGVLKEEYRDLWALYYTKYIKAYLNEGIKISAITIQNEPKATQTWESCVWTGEAEREFIEHYVIPVFEKEGLQDIKIIIWDHNKERVFERAKEVLSSPKVNERVWAVGHHWYTGDHYEGLRLVHEELHKPHICTEFCSGIQEDPIDVAETYAKDMCENLNHYMIASCDWNILLSDQGGPFHNRTAETVSVGGKIFESKSGGLYAPVLFDKKENQLIYTPIYYYIGHFSKFIQRGAKRIAVTKYTNNIYVCGFKNPDSSIVLVVMNPTDEDAPIVIRQNKVNTEYQMKAHSIITVVKKS